MSKRYKVKRFSSCYLMNWVDNKTNKELTALEIEEILHKQDQQIAELKQQLGEKEKEIIYLTKQVKKFNNEAQKYFEDAYCNDFHNQDKISFAIEQLDNFLKIIHSHEKIYLSLNDFKIINEIFEQQIKRLTHQHEDKGEWYGS